jgi:signal transduction histidine kinase
MDTDTLDSMRCYVGFDEAMAAELSALFSAAAPHFPAIVDDFYRAIESHPRARSVITGGPAQIERLKRTLADWLASVLQGPYDGAYVQAHARIGKVHVRIALPQELMFTAMNRIRARLLEVVQDAYAAERARAESATRAVNAVLDLELAIMLDAYHEVLAEKVRVTERLATIGQLTASIAHELRNPLSAIDSSLFLVRRHLEKTGAEDAVLAKHHQRIAEQIDHSAKTIDDLLDLARDRPPRRRRTKLAPLLERALEHSNTRERLDVRLSVPDDLTVDVDADDMSLVLANLLLNAAEAQGQNGTVHLSAGERAGGVEIRVCDDGPGVPREIRHQIFDALFTTKAHGTGLGLALCRRIIDAHGGELELLDSERGTCLRIWLPRLDSALLSPEPR